jgi:diguanylate cyclase (GGDEF)-like protein
VADLGVAPDIDRDAIILELMLLGGKIGLNAEAHGALIDQMLACWRDWGEVLKVPVNTLPTFDNMVAMPAPPDGNGFLATSVRVLVVEDDPSSQLLAVRTLASLFGKNVHAASNGQEALALALEVTPQIVVTDWHMPVMDGLEFCRALRATEWGQSIYVIMLTGTDEDQEIIDAFDAGVDDYVTKPLNVRALRARLRAALHYVKLLESWERDRAQLRQFAAELALSNRRLEHLALTDLLTGLPNRRAGMNALAEAWSAANRGGQDVTVMTIDIDRFKSVNDTYGHAIGDSVLIEVAAVIRNTARKEDSICRFGGEEFLIVCRHTDLKSSLQAAERLRVAVKSLNIKTSAGVIQTSVSIGVAIKEPSMTDVDALVKSSDMALYSAKHGGRDRTCVYTGGKVHCVKT